MNVETITDYEVERLNNKLNQFSQKQTKILLMSLVIEHIPQNQRLDFLDKALAKFWQNGVV